MKTYETEPASIVAIQILNGPQIAAQHHHHCLNFFFFLQSALPFLSVSSMQGCTEALACMSGMLHLDQLSLFNASPAL